MEWYEDQNALAEAVEFVVSYSMVYDWNAFASAKTPCYDYATEDSNIPEDLKRAVKEYYLNLAKKERRELNKEIALLLGERFFVRTEALVKIISRILRDGDPRQESNMIAMSLKMQIEQRIKLLELLKVS